MTTWLLALPIVLPLGVAGLQLVAPRWPRWHRAGTLATLALTTAAAFGLLASVDASTLVTHAVGAWPPPFGIVLVADPLSAFMLVTAEVVLLVVAVASWGHEDPEVSLAHPAYLLMAAGLALVFTTGDLFNLFVAFEVTITASYVFLAGASIHSGSRPMAAYVTVNLLSTSVFLAAVAIVYGSTGTVNLADLVSGMDTMPPPLAGVVGALLFVVFATKAGAVPWSMWLPASYPAIPAPAVAAVAGLLAEVGVYGLLRVHVPFFSEMAVGSTALVVVGVASVVVGVVGALTRDELRRILSWDLVSQIGFAVSAVGIGTPLAVAAGIYFVLHHAVIKTGLFLITGLLENMGEGTVHLGGGDVIRRAPLAAVAFAVLGAGLAGFPPLSGFFAKVAIIRSAVATGHGEVVAAVVVGTTLTVVLMARLWSRVFLDPGRDRRLHRPGAGSVQVAIGAVTIASLAVAVAAEPLLGVAENAARVLTEPAGYARGVLE